MQNLDCCPETSMGEQNREIQYIFTSLHEVNLAALGHAKGMES
jgi:hypothetical protein